MAENLGEGLARLDHLVVADKHVAQITTYFRGDDRRVGLHIGVVCGYPKATRDPVVPSVDRDPGKGCHRSGEQEQAPRG